MILDSLVRINLIFDLSLLARTSFALRSFVSLHTPYEIVHQSLISSCIGDSPLEELQDLLVDSMSTILVDVGQGWSGVCLSTMGQDNPSNFFDDSQLMVDDVSTYSLIDASD
jgi:hypothetical protein